MTYLPNASLHRPRGWIMHMDWDDLLFAHYTVDPSVLRPHIPAGLELETWDGKAWLGVVPFRMAGVRPRFIPRIPGLSEFAELNLRTYVRRGGIPGVWFFSLDAASPFAVRAARRFFHLPYFDADMKIERDGAAYAYSSRRTHWGEPEGAFEARYAPAGPAYKSLPGTLDDWLTARYCLYAADSEGNIFRGDIHHKPWRLQAATAEIKVNTLGHRLGLDFSAQKPHLLFSEHTEVVAWLPEFLGP
jgi:uncharacterized protein YqjF (DUF2071 family)